MAAVEGAWSCRGRYVPRLLWVVPVAMEVNVMAAVVPWPLWQLLRPSVFLE